MKSQLVRKGGTEGDLLKHSLMLDLLETLCPQEGEFWFLDGNAGEGQTAAHEVARSWFARMDEEPQREEKASTPLWEIEQEALEDGEYMDSSALALRALSGRRGDPLSMRWVFCHPDMRTSRAFSEHLEVWSEMQDNSKRWENSPHRFFQMVGKAQEQLQESVYLGMARAPGLAVLEPPELHEDCSQLLLLLETLLLRRFWVMLVFPTKDKEGKRRTISNAIRETLIRGVGHLQASGAQLRLEGKRTPEVGGTQAEVWVMTGEAPVGDWMESSLLNLQKIFVDGLGLKRGGEHGVEGLYVDEFHRQGEPNLKRFQREFPVTLFPDVYLDQAKEEDLEEIIRLWERLMDEHAVLDTHFQRRSLARIYLRRSFRSQLAQPDYLLLVARWHHRVVAFLSAQVLRAPLFQESRFGQIVDVYLLPEWRKQKIGTALVEQSYRWFRALGLSQVDLNIAHANARAEAFWKKQGFAPYLEVVSKEI